MNGSPPAEGDITAAACGCQRKQRLTRLDKRSRFGRVDAHCHRRLRLATGHLDGEEQRAGHAMVGHRITMCIHDRIANWHSKRHGMTFDFRRGSSRQLQQVNAPATHQSQFGAHGTPFPDNDPVVGPVQHSNLRHLGDERTKSMMSKLARILAGLVDKDIDLPEPGFRLLHGMLDCLRIRPIERNGQRIVMARNQTGQRRHIPCGCDHPESLID